MPSTTQDTGYRVILVTVGAGEEAQEIATELVRQRQAACVNIVSGVRSLFWWQGEVDSAEENLLVIKTTAGKVNEIVSLINQLHSYEVPEVITLPIAGGNRDYLEWVGNGVV